MARPLAGSDGRRCLSASIPYRARRLWLLPVLIVVVAAACGSSETETNVAQSPEPPGLSVNDLVCQLDPPTFTATALGGIRNALPVDIPRISPVVTWLDADDAVISSKTGASIAIVPAGDTAVFSIPAILVDGMAACRIELSGAGPVPVSGKLTAEAFLTLELAK